MLRGTRLTTLLLTVVLLNPSRIDSDRTRGTRDVGKDGSVIAGTSKKVAQQNDETELNRDVAAAFEHAQYQDPQKRQIQEKPVIHHAKEPSLENEIHVEVLDRHKRDEGAEREFFSGEESRVEVKDKERKEIDPENGEHELSGENSEIEARDFNSDHPTDDEDMKTEWEHFQMQLLSNEKNDDDFGYITNAEEDDDSEENDDESLSSERDYGHAHIKALHVQHRSKQKKGARGSHVMGKIVGEEDEDEDEDEEVVVKLSGEGQGPSRAKQKKRARDSHEIVGEDEDEDEDEEVVVELSGEGQGLSSIYDRRNLSGAEGLSARGENKILEENDGDTVLQAEKAKNKKENSGKEGIPEENKEEPDRHIKNTRKGNKLANKTKIPKKTIIREKQEKPSFNKKKGPSVNNQIPHQWQKRKVHEEIDLTHKKKTLLPKEKTSKNTKDAIHVFKAQKTPKIRDVESQTGTESDLNKEEDFYIDESDKPKERMFLVEMHDVTNDKDHGENTSTGNQKINKRALSEDDKAEGGQEFRRGNSRHLLQVMNTSHPFNALPEFSTYCSHQALGEEIADQSIVYIRTECRLCQCSMGELICDPMPEYCDQLLAKSCVMSNGHLEDGARHFDGCNNCVCRNGDLLCTRIRCAAVNYNYTNYRNVSYNNSTPENSLVAVVNEEIVRGMDWCLECDSFLVSPVCGPNWKTYRSICHAHHCGGFNIEDVTQGKCENLHPCDGIKCAEHEICIVDRRGPCLATLTRNGEIIPCPQHQCVIPRDELNCSMAKVETICGEDHNIYLSKCSMFSRGVALAYYGPCKEECLKLDAKVCGVDGVTFQSSCHASLHNSHVDYPGECDEVDETNDNSFKNSPFGGNFNARCKTVTELLRCPGANCQNPVIPEGSCCPICGTAISIRLDSSAKDMISLNAQVQPPQELNRVDVIFTDLKNLFDQTGGVGKCQLTIDLVDTHDISLVYEPITSLDEDTCKQVATRAVEFINSPAKSDVEPAKALLAVAVIKDRPVATGLPRAESLMGKRVMKRTTHHEHEPFFNESHRIRLHHNFLLFLAILSLYWFTNQLLN